MNHLGLFQEAASALQEGHAVGLVTVIGTKGSTPARPGYMMLVLPEGQETSGTVGGGLVEATMINEATAMLGAPRRRVCSLDIGKTPGDEKGLCGGTVEFLIETFDRTALPLFMELAEAADHDEGAVLVSILSPEGSVGKRLWRAPAGHGSGAVAGFAPEILEAIQNVAGTGKGPRRVSSQGMDVFLENVSRSPEAVIFGAGHVSHAIARYAKSVHFRVIVCDDRSEYANREGFPDADEIVVEDFGRAFEQIRIDGRSYIVIVTRGHVHDQIVLEQALKTPARYIGMIGSRRKTLAILDRLRQKGTSQELLDRVYSPVGLAIGAVTPEEISLSIVAEMVKIRRLGDGACVGHMTLSRSKGQAWVCP